jgi:hypothetical protein
MNRRELFHRLHLDYNRVPDDKIHNLLAQKSAAIPNLIPLLPFEHDTDSSQLNRQRPRIDLLE